MAKPGVKVIDNILKFVDGNVRAMDTALNRMAIDIERQAKQVVPHKDGQLKASGHHKRVGFLVYQTIFSMVYARYQEFGGDGVRVVRHYSKPGKKAHYLKDSGDMISARAMDYFRQEAKKIKNVA